MNNFSRKKKKKHHDALSFKKEKFKSPVGSGWEA